MVAVLLPNSLRALFPGAPSKLDVHAGTVGAALDELDRHWPGMRARLCDEHNAIRRHITLFVDGERARLDTELSGASELIVMPAFSGG
jgi:molybdopterin converting factor small subunit